MSPELRTLYVLGTLAATAKVARVSLEGKPRLIDRMAQVSAQYCSLFDRPNALSVDRGFRLCLSGECD